MADIAAFAPGDPANPRNWPEWRKWAIVLILIPVDFNVSWGASGYSPALKKFITDFDVSQEVGTLGLSMFVLGLAFGPMILAPLSEYFGRSPIYIISYFIYMLFMMATALVPNLGGFLVLRLLAGLFSAVTIGNYGGTIADLWPHQRTGYAMSLFLWAATCGSPSGYFLFSFVAQYRPWRDTFWALTGVTGGFWLLMTLVLKETRHTTILRARAKKALKADPKLASEDSVAQQHLQDLLRHRSAKELFTIALARPFRFLFTEVIVVFAALYNGYLYGISFLLNGAFSLVFGPTGHGFSTDQVGLAFLGISTGITIGVVTNILQEQHYQRTIKGKGPHANVPEARVQMGKIAAITHPIALFWFAWTTYKSVHWIVPILATGLWGWSFYTLILMSYLYLEDSYGVFSASALAGIGLVRNTAGAGFPLFGIQMFEHEGYQWAGSILAFLAIVLVPIPFILEKFGPRMRKRSPFASQLAHEHEDGGSATAEKDDL